MPPLWSRVAWARIGAHAPALQDDSLHPWLLRQLARPVAGGCTVGLGDNAVDDRGGNAVGLLHKAARTAKKVDRDRRQGQLDVRFVEKNEIGDVRAPAAPAWQGVSPVTADRRVRATCPDVSVT